MLLAYTTTIDQFDVLMHDNEGDMDGMVKELAGLWKRTLKKSDKELGIDAKYTRPGLDTMLTDFQKKVEACFSKPPFRFPFK